MISKHYECLLHHLGTKDTHISRLDVPIRGHTVKIYICDICSFQLGLLRNYYFERMDRVGIKNVRRRMKTANKLCRKLNMPEMILTDFGSVKLTRLPKGAVVYNYKRLAPCPISVR